MQRLTALHARTRAAGNSFQESIAVALQAVLISPHFLFRIEGDSPQVTPYELASRLSYFLWNTPPDAELLKLAETNGLSKPGVVDAQVKRMLAAADNHCVALRRSQIGQLKLDDLGLAEGEWCYLDAAQLALLAPA